MLSAKAMLSAPKLACVYAPNLPVQVERAARPAHPAPLLISHPVGGSTVFAASDDLLAAGVSPGQSLYQARQAAPAAVVVEPDEAEYHARHDAMLAALRNYSRAVETVGLGEFLLDVRGLERIHDGDQRLAVDLAEAARSASRLAVQVGVGTGRFIAQQAARRYAAQAVAPGEEARFVAAFPITDLPDLPGEMQRRLTLLDIHTLRGLAALRKPAVLRQFGAEASLFYELARGHDPRPLQPDLPPLRLVRSMTLAMPIADRQVILNVITHLSRRLSRTLILRGYHAEALKLVLEVAAPVRLEQGQALKPPTAEEGRLGRLAQQLLGRLGAAQPVWRVSLCAYPLRAWSLDAHQLALVQGGVPEKRARLENALQLILRRFGQAALFIASLLGPPIPLKVQMRLSQGRPALLTFAGQSRLIQGVDEAWREEKGWWDTRAVRREYYRLILDDDSLRNVFHDLNNDEWYLDRAWPIL